MGLLNTPTGDLAVKAPIVAGESVTVHAMACCSLMLRASCPSLSDVAVVDTEVIDEEGTVVAIADVVVVTGKGVVDVTVHMEENVVIPLLTVATGQEEAVVDIAEVMRMIVAEVKVVAVVSIVVNVLSQGVYPQLSLQCDGLTVATLTTLT